MARGQKLQDGMATDEARTAGNQNCAHRRHLNCSVLSRGWSDFVDSQLIREAKEKRLIDEVRFGIR